MQRIQQGISPQASEEFGITCCFATKAAELAGKQQGIPGLTVQLSPYETGIAFIPFSQNFSVGSYRRCREGKK